MTLGGRRGEEAASIPELELDSGEMIVEDGDTHQGERGAPVQGGAFDRPRPGAQIGGRYILERELGKGAAGVVFEARHAVIGKRVAVKCLYPQHRATPNAVERFFREARIAASVEHPNVIDVFDGGDEGDVLFLAMELLDGESLAARLERGRLELDDILRIFSGIADGVAAVHDAGAVHRDLKPDNIFLLRADDRPMVLDFGISKLKEPGQRELTSMGTVMGSPFYMAPEQIASTRDVDARADVYALGVMLYEALTGDVPYGDDSVLEIFRRASQSEYEPVATRRPDVPPALVDLVHRALGPSPGDRFESMEELHAALVALRTRDTAPGQGAPSAGPFFGSSPIDARAPRLGAESSASDTLDSPAPFGAKELSPMIFVATGVGLAVGALTTAGIAALIWLVAG